MIQKFIDRFEEHRDSIRHSFEKTPPRDYINIVETVVQYIGGDGYGEPDAKRIHVIDDGDYQGTILYVIGSNEYQPSNYWFVKVGYGSCSGCDTLQAIHDDKPEDQTDQYMTLALHIVQGLKSMNERE